MHRKLPEFDVLLDMALHRPHELEAMRVDFTAAVIDSAPGELRRRLEGLQFQIDNHRRLAKTPLAACLMFSRMMHDSFDQLRLALNDGAVTDKASTPSAKVLSFPGA